MTDDAKQVDVDRIEWTGSQPRSSMDTVTREEPMEIRLRGISVAVLMRTPGHDEELGTGFLITERIVCHPDEIVSVRHCTTVEHPEAEDNILLAKVRNDVPLDLEKLRRNLYASSSCGICGKATLESAMAHGEPITDDMAISHTTLYGFPEALRKKQDVFEHTGGLHGVGLFASDGRCLVVREDIGRHNAVDKVIGWAAQQQALPLRGHILMVSGRVSYEIVQKALAARIPMIAAVSAPSSLAIDLAKKAGITLVGFLRGERLCVYAHGERIQGE